MHQSLDITPSPRVLRMLGQIDFAPWQCLAELIDNSIDAFLDDSAISNPRVVIKLPTDSELKGEDGGTLVLQDNGPGMSLEQLENAVRAGYSGNDPVEKMGLFGMGFNISTARLGRRTEVWTTTAEMLKWVGVVIDFDELEQHSTFSVSVESKEKTEQELEVQDHGTKVYVTKLEADRVRPLIWGNGKAKAKRRLGKVYGRVMQNLDIRLIYDGDLVKPWRHCVWDAKRSVHTKDFGNVNAIIGLDKELSPRKFCTTCWIWLAEKDKECPACGKCENVINRNRHLSGWIGVQRFFDKEHYGFDLIRNGRVIEDLDKSLFYFKNDQGDETLEYPLDATHWGGRIVGELEINFVRVSHQKDSFDKLDPEWKHVVHIIRGNSPLRPKIAERQGYPRNISPLGQLYAGYRAGHAGLKDLVPGDSSGKGLNSGIIRDWVDRFYTGEAAYQSDKKWYELVLQVEEANRGGSTGGDDAAGELPIDVPDTNELDRNEEERGCEVPEPSEESSTEAVIPGSEGLLMSDPELSRTYKLEFGGNNVSVTVKAYSFTEHSTKNAPYSIEAKGYIFKFYYNLRHALFEESLESPLDCLLTDLAQYFLTLAAESPRNHPVSRIERRLRKKYFPQTRNDVTFVADTARAFLKELRGHIDEVLPSIAPIDIEVINDEALDKIRRRALQVDLDGEEAVNEKVKAGQFINYVDNSFLIVAIQQWPQLVMDDQFFSVPYDDIQDSLKKKATSMLVNGLEDIRWLADEGHNTISKDNDWRLRYTRAIASMRFIESLRS